MFKVTQHIQDLEQGALVSKDPGRGEMAGDGQGRVIRQEVRGNEGRLKTGGGSRN